MQAQTVTIERILELEQEPEPIRTRLQELQHQYGPLDRLIIAARRHTQPEYEAILFAEFCECGKPRQMCAVGPYRVVIIRVPGTRAA